MKLKKEFLIHNTNDESLLPFLPFYRLFRGIVVHGRTVISEIKALFRYRREEQSDHRLQKQQGFSANCEEDREED